MKPLFGSLLSRILWLHVLALAATAVAAPLAAYLLLSSTTTGFQHRVLLNHAERIARALTPDQAGWRLDLAPDLRALYAQQYGGFAFAVVDAGGRPLFTSLPGAAAPYAEARRAPGATYFQTRLGQADYYGASVPEVRDGRRVWVVVMQNLRHPDVVVDDIVAGFLPRIALLIAPVLLALLAVDILIVRRALRPVVHASEMARDIDPARMDRRLPVSELPTEIAPLATAVNQALDRLEAGFRVQRAFTADAAHELRTPLPVLRMRIDALLDEDAAAVLRADVESMARVVGQLLEIAELDDAGAGGDEVADLRAAALEVVSQIAPLAVGRGKSMALTGVEAPVWVRARASAVHQAVRNLAENAVHHTGPGGVVEVEISADGVVRVLDDGPGIAEDQAPHLFQRFWRADRRKPGGSGLGLSIVARVAAAHGGAVSFENRQGGGAAFTLTLPLAPAAD